MSAKTAEQLMRSRYCAYVLNDTHYLYETWYEPQSRGIYETTLTASNHSWQSLEILDKSQIGNSAEVEFRASYIDDKGQAGSLHERSRFIRKNGRWLYVDGDIFSQ